jgi:hypothetical protein
MGLQHAAVRNGKNPNLPLMKLDVALQAMLAPGGYVLPTPTTHTVCSQDYHLTLLQALRDIPKNALPLSQ